MPPDLYTRVFERTAFPLLDRLNGTHIRRTLDHLLGAEHDDPAAMQQRQWQRAERVVQEARQRSTFYRRLWDERPGLASEIPALDGLPVVTKQDLAQAGDAFPLPANGSNVKTITCVTSGSTGKPMSFHRSLDQDSWFWAERFRIWRWAGYRPGDPYLTVNLNPRLAWKKKLQDRLFRCAYLTFNADNLDAERIVMALTRRKIRHLNGFSSSLFVLAQHMLRRGLRASSVSGITATGDTLFPVYRETIEQAFGVRVLDYYGAGGEGVHLASQCSESGSRYHLLPENAVMELLDENGPVPPGQTGRIIVTQFHNAVMPLVRYELGDLAVPAPPDVRCSCGRTLPMLERLEGRVPDLIAVSDGTYLVPHFFVVLFKSLQSVYRYQIHQREFDHMRVRLVPHPGCDMAEVESAVTREVTAGTRGLIRPEFEWLDEIPLSGAGKRRLVISEVGQRPATPNDRPLA